MLKKPFLTHSMNYDSKNTAVEGSPLDLMGQHQSPCKMTRHTTKWYILQLFMFNNKYGGILMFVIIVDSGEQMH